MSVRGQDIPYWIVSHSVWVVTAILAVAILLVALRAAKPVVVKAYRGHHVVVIIVSILVALIVIAELSPTKHDSNSVSTDSTSTSTTDSTTSTTEVPVPVRVLTPTTTYTYHESPPPSVRYVPPPSATTTTTIELPTTTTTEDPVMAAIDARTTRCAPYMAQYNKLEQTYEVALINGGNADTELNAVVGYITNVMSPAGC